MKHQTREVKLGNLVIGGNAPVTVQSMLNARSDDVAANVAQALRLEKAGCQVIRVSVPHMKNVELIPALKAAVAVPIVADIHFDYRIAIAAVKAGVNKIRLNPGNVGGPDKVRAVAEACKAAGVPIRIGVNGGSLEEALREKHGGPTAQALVESALNHAKLLEECDFHDIVISLKSSHVPTNVAAYSLLSQQCDYPLHLGVTEAGLYHAGLVKNAVGIGALLLQGIGNTIRVSLADEPEKEVQVGFDILRAAGLPVAGPEVIACPTCGRTNIPIAAIAAEVEEKLVAMAYAKPIKVAVMGCVVNGIGEGREADIGIAGGVESAVLFIKGKQVRTIRGDYVNALIEAIQQL